MGESKKHHYVPQTLLRNFQNEDEELFVFDKINERGYTSNAFGAGCENYFNTVRLNTDKINYESGFDNNDSILGKLLMKVKSFTTHYHFTKGEILDLCLVTATQRFRTMKPRVIMNKVDDYLAEHYPEKFNIQSGQKQNPEQGKILTLHLLRESDKLAKLLMERKIVVYKASNDKKFCISDNPVVYWEYTSQRMMGLETPGMDVYFPLSKDTLLGFICNYNYEQAVKSYNFSKAYNLPIPSKTNSLVRAVENGEVFMIEDTDPYNFLQIMDSVRYLYSSTNDFTQVEHLLKEYPEIKFDEETIKQWSESYLKFTGR